MRVVCSNIVIGLYILDMWSVLCVRMCMVCSNILIRTVRTGHVVSVVCYVCGWWDLI